MLKNSKYNNFKNNFSIKSTKTELYLQNEEDDCK